MFLANALAYGSVVPPVIVAFGFAPILRPGQRTVPAHSYVRMIHPNMLSLHEIINAVAYKWAPAWEDIVSGRWQVWQARCYSDMSKIGEPLAFMTFPGALCLTEPGRLHAPLLVATSDTPGYQAAREAAISRLPSPAHLPQEAVLLSLYFHQDEPVSVHCILSSSYPHK
jgi:hypothetical protein